MKLGYSILLGEYVSATAADYTDCKSLQIVCPACKEPVFKGLRQEPGVSNQDTHYFSHYRASTAIITDCENRVGEITTPQILKASSTGRNQRLEIFQRVLRDAILDGTNFLPLDRETAESHDRCLARSKVVRKLFVNMEGQVRSLWRDYSRINKLIQDFTRTVNSSTYPSGMFSRASQERITWDLMQHLLTGPMRENLEFLFRRSLLTVWSDWMREEEGSGCSGPTSRGQLLESVLFDPPSAAGQAYDALYETIHPQGVRQSQIMMSEAGYLMVGYLLFIPYFDLIKANGKVLS